MAEKQKVCQAHHHHHRGQNRPHQKTITHPQGPPPEPVEPDTKFLHGGEGLVGPPLPLSARQKRTGHRAVALPLALLR